MLPQLTGNQGGQLPPYGNQALPNPMPIYQPGLFAAHPLLPFIPRVVPPIPAQPQVPPGFGPLTPEFISHLLAQHRELTERNQMLIHERRRDQQVARQRSEELGRRETLLTQKESYLDRGYANLARQREEFGEQKRRMFRRRAESGKYLIRRFKEEILNLNIDRDNFNNQKQMELMRNEEVHQKLIIDKEEFEKQKATILEELRLKDEELKKEIEVQKNVRQIFEQYEAKMKDQLDRREADLRESKQEVSRRIERVKNREKEVETAEANIEDRKNQLGVEEKELSRKTEEMNNREQKVKADLEVLENRKRELEVEELKKKEMEDQRTQLESERIARLEERETNVKAALEDVENRTKKLESDEEELEMKKQMFLTDQLRAEDRRMKAERKETQKKEKMAAGEPTRKRQKKR